MKFDYIQTYETNKINKIQRYRPRSFLERDYWLIWAKEPGVATQHGCYEYKWTLEIEKKPHANMAYVPSGAVIVEEKDTATTGKPSYPYLPVPTKKYILYDVCKTWIKKVDDELWVDDTLTPAYHWERGRYNSASHEVLKQSLKEAQKKRNKVLEAVRKEQNRIQAEKEGISVKELKDKKQLVLQEKRKIKTTTKNLEKTKKIISIAPELKTLQEQIEFILSNLTKNPDKISLRNAANVKNRISRLVYDLEKWIKNK
jgi:Arc/MetJ-type ribon-helix-helix transcriptional regulator